MDEDMTNKPPTPDPPPGIRAEELTPLEIQVARLIDAFLRELPNGWEAELPELRFLATSLAASSVEVTRQQAFADGQARGRAAEISEALKELDERICHLQRYKLQLNNVSRPFDGVRLDELLLLLRHDEHMLIWSLRARDRR